MTLSCPSSEIDVRVQDRQMQMMRVEFTAREGEDQQPLRTGDLRHPLGALLKLTIPYVVREVTTGDRGSLRATPVSDEEEGVLVEAVEAYGKRGPQRGVDDRARLAFKEYTKAQEQGAKPLIDQVRKALQKEQGLERLPPPSPPHIGWSLAGGSWPRKRGRPMMEGHVQKKSNGRWYPVDPAAAKSGDWKAPPGHVGRLRDTCRSSGSTAGRAGEGRIEDGRGPTERPLVPISTTGWRASR